MNQKQFLFIVFLIWSLITVVVMATVSIEQTRMVGGYILEYVFIFTAICDIGVILAAIIAGLYMTYQNLGKN